MNEERVSIVTGAGSGIGAAVAKKLAAFYHGRVVLNYKSNRAGVEVVAAECRTLGAKTLIVQADVSQRDECEKLVKVVIDEWGCVYDLVNNAGITCFPKELNDLGSQVEDFQSILNTNLYGTYCLIALVVPLMEKSGGGAIVNVSSKSAFTGIGSSFPYAASKAALNALTLGLSTVLAPKNIRVNAVCPGVVLTPWWSRKFEDKELLFQFQERHRRANNLFEADEVAGSILLLLDSNMTGEVIRMKAGLPLSQAKKVVRPKL